MHYSRVLRKAGGCQLTINIRVFFLLYVSKDAVFWYVVPCSVMCEYRRFAETASYKTTWRHIYLEATRSSIINEHT